MITGTKYNYQEIKKMSGLDQVEVHAALRRWMDLASEQYSLLRSYYYLEEILTIKDIPKIENALMIIKQLHARIRDLHEHFKNTPASNVLDNSLRTIESFLEEGSKYATWSLSFRPDSFSRCAAT